MDPGLGDAVRVAGQFLRREGPGHPTEVLAIDAVRRERSTDQADDRHATVSQPAVHVLAAHRQTLSGTFGF